MKSRINNRFNTHSLAGYLRLCRCSIQHNIFSYLLVISLLLGSTNTALGQSAGDYRSNGININWGAAASWQKYDGSSWIVATDYPGQNPCGSCTINIQNGAAVTLNLSPANPIENLVTGSGSTGTLNLGTFSLVVAGDLTVNKGATLNLAGGNLSVGGSSVNDGTITDASNAGVNMFTGAVLNNTGSWNTTAVTTAANLIFKKDVSNVSGIFTASAASFADSATIDAAALMSFKGIVTAAGLLTAKGSGGVVFGNNTTVSGDLIITSGGALVLGSTGFITVTGITTINGSFTDASNAGVNTFTKLVINNGIFNTDSIVTAANLRLNGGFSNEAGATAIISAARLAGNIAGNTPITFKNAVTTNGPVTITGGEVTIGGTANTLLTSSLTINSGATLKLTTSGTFTAATVTNAGNFTDSDDSKETTFTGLFSNSGTVDFSALSAPHLLFNSGVVHSGTIFNVPTATISTTYNGVDITATSPVNFSGEVLFTGSGTLSISGAGGVTFSGSATVWVPAALQVAALSSVTASTTGNFTVNGTASLAGSFTDSDNTGITTFTGLITKTGGAWNSTAVTTAANMIFLNGINQTAGTFNAGAVSVPDGTMLKSTPAMTFNNAIEIGGAGNLIIGGTGGVVFAGTSINYTIPGNLSLMGLLTVSTTGNFTVAGTTSITSTGGFTDSENTGVSTFNGLVTHNSTGRWTTTAVTTAANLIFNEGFTNTAGVFAAGAATIADNKTLRGTVNMAFSNGLDIKGNGDITIAGTATNGVSLGGTLINYTVRNLAISGRLTVSTTGNFSVAGTTVISSTGNFLDNNTTGTTTFTGLLTIGSSATFTTTAVNIIGRLLIAGGIVQNNTAANAFVAGTIRTTAGQTWSGAGSIATTSILDINAGTLTNNVSGVVTAGGSLTGIGTSWVQGANAKLSLNSSTPFTISTLVSNTVGNTIIYGSAANATIKAQPYFNLVISGSNIKFVPPADITVEGSLTINSGVLNTALNGKTIFVAGNWINNAGTSAYNAGNGTVVFNGTSVQTLGGTAATTFGNINVKNPGGILQTAGCLVNGILKLELGKITTGNNAVAIGSSGLVVRTAGYIAGKETIYFNAGASVAKTFDVGDASAYTPLYLLASGITSPGNITIQSTGNDHPAMANSELNNNLSVNRYWALTNDSTVLNSYSALLTFAPADRDPSLNTAGMAAGIYSSGWQYPAVSNRTQTGIQVIGIKTLGDIAVAERKTCTTAYLVINNPAGLCLPATADLTAAGITAGSDSTLLYTYWTNSTATNTLTVPSAVKTGTYYIRGTRADGTCSSIKPVIIGMLNPGATVSGTKDICTGDSTVVTIKFTGSAPWSGVLSDGSPFRTDSSTLSLTVTPAGTTDYEVLELTDTSNCAARPTDLNGHAMVNIIEPATQANAGDDQSTCGEFTTLAGNIPEVGTGRWSVAEGDGGSFSNADSAATKFYGLPGVSYKLKWSISNGNCVPSQDDVIVAFTTGLWTGAKDTAWYNPENWCGNVVPTGIFNLSLGDGLRNYPVIPDSVTINDLFLSRGASLTITGILNIKGSYKSTGKLNNRGTLIIAGSGLVNFPGQGTVIGMQNLKFESTAPVIIDQSFTVTGTLSCAKGTVDLADKFITLKADSLGTATVGTVTGKFIYSRSGRFIVQGYVPAKKAWRLLTAPVTGSNSIFSSWQANGINSPGSGTFITGPGGGNGLDGAGNATLKRFDTTSQLLVPVVNTNVPVSPGTLGNADNAGYFMFINGDRSGVDGTSTILTSTGKLQTGNQIHHTDYYAGKFTLVGNAYASAVDFGQTEKTNIINRFYAWDPELNQVGGYIVLDDLDADGEYTKSILSGRQDKIIASHQAFFVQTKANAFGSVIFHESNKYKGTTLSGGGPSSVKESLDAELYLLNTDNSTILADGTRAEFDPAYANDVNMEDAVKFTNVNENFSWVTNGTELAIERRNMINEGDTLFLKLTKTSQRNYQFKFTGKNLAYRELAAFLNDKYLGTKTKISLVSPATVNFSVTADTASASAGRFYITFRAASFAVNYSRIKGYRSNRDIAVEWSIEKELGIVKYDVQKSLDGINYTTIKTVIPTANNNTEVIYSMLDKHPIAGSNFYRIRSTDLDSSSVYSRVINVKMSQVATGISIYPNPVQNNYINILLANQPAGTYQLLLTAQGNGQKILATAFTLAAGNNNFGLQVPHKLAKGLYNLKLTGPDAQETIMQVLVQ